MTGTGSYQAADLIELSTSIVTAYVANNSIPASELVNLLGSVHAAVKGISEGGAEASPKDEVVKRPPGQIKRSITPDALISFEDGKAYKTLRRHLTTRGLTPEGYRAKWGLPHDYPMTAANYSTARSKLARSLGLGTMRYGSGKDVKAKADEVRSEAAVEAKSKRAERPRKAAAE
ncbi:MucR family transcriptional regulator [Methylobacterium gossipiicola]|uniref:Predicted transcriptional regulator n=1 Tax=Methylobacterium gossipiicola TaxID=582675 RepID=A0A1I2UQQ5_9HYPH|nr:MucR family transcriptional regulator [Methylobacterium gossipiicola]SFG79474.1 Predicted transcriptional regulator [Methylobacterium gossipiicola]